MKSNGTDGGTGSTIVRLTKAVNNRRKRVILKNGSVNLSKLHVSKRSQRYLQDIFTTLVDIQWRYNLMVCRFYLQNFSLKSDYCKNEIYCIGLYFNMLNFPLQHPQES